MKNLSGIVLGALVGAGLGVLFAPDKGEITRKKIKEEALSAKEGIDIAVSELSNDIREAVKDLKEDTSKSYSSKKENFDKEFENIISKVSYKTENIIDTLEMKLKRLKEQNKKFQKNVS